MSDEERLLVVEEAFVARGKGVLVMPRFSFVAREDMPRAGFAVRLDLPDGTSRMTTAQIEVAHMQGKLAPYAMYRLPELGVEDVPIGTSIRLVRSS